MVSRIMLLLGLLLVTCVTSAQIPNPSFEFWTNGNPNGWTTPNFAGIFVPVTPHQPGAAGTTALKGTVLGLPEGNVPPYALATFDVSFRPTALTGSYIFNPLGGDNLMINIGVYNLTTGQGGGSGELTAPPTGSTYQTFTVPIEYNDETGVPESGLIQIRIDGENDGTPGSVMIIDNLVLSTTPTSVAESGLSREYSLAQNYPNPFNPATTIEFELGRPDRVRLRVFDVLGREIATLAEGPMEAGRHRVRFDASGLPSGVYLYRLETPGATATGSMVLAR